MDYIFSNLSDCYPFVFKPGLFDNDAVRFTLVPNSSPIKAHLYQTRLFSRKAFTVLQKICNSVNQIAVITAPDPFKLLIKSYWIIFNTLFPRNGLAKNIVFYRGKNDLKET